MAITDPFKSAIEDYLSRAGMNPTAFGWATTKDPRLVFDLRGGRTFLGATDGPGQGLEGGSSVVIERGRKMAAVFPRGGSRAGTRLRPESGSAAGGA